LVAELDDYTPTVIATYPTAAVLLAAEARAGRLRCRPAEIWTGGEHLSAAMRAAIVEAFGCAVRASYGASEFLSMGWECAHGRLHLNSDWVILEPVDAQGRPVPPGVPSHTTLLTNLANHLQPLIRYDLGDQVRVAAAPCTCGAALPTFEVQGRRDEVLCVPGRAGGTVALLPLVLTTVLEDEAGVFDFQLRQTREGHWCLQLGEGGAAGRAAAARCRRVLADFLAHMGAQPIELVIRTGVRLGRGRSGKVVRVVGSTSAGAP
jgi:phenylacetate-coenzyme A ligase PaaK-like adenylate-forming protein